MGLKPPLIVDVRVSLVNMLKDKYPAKGDKINPIVCV